MTVLLELKGKLRETYKVTLFSLVASLIIGFFGGTFLGKYFDKIRSSYPGLLVILPGMMGLRGNVFGSMASRFSTMLYLGDLEPSLRDRNVLRNIVVGIILSMIPVTLLWCIGVLKGIKENAFEIFLIVISSTVVVSILLGYFTAFVTIFTFKRGTDPDSIAAPLVTSMGDLLTIPSIITFILVLEYSVKEFWLSISALIVTFIILIRISRIRLWELLEFREIFITVTFLALFSAISGGLLEHYSDVIHRSILLSFAYPPLLSSFGNYGSVIAAKTSTKLHLGEINKFLSLGPFLDILSLFTTTPLIGLLINTFSILVAKLVLGVSIKPVFFLALTYPFMALFIMLFSYSLSYVLFMRNIDPDNVAIPLLTTIADILGTIYTVFVAKLVSGG